MDELIERLRAVSARTNDPLLLEAAAALEAAREDAADAERYRWLRRREGNNRWPHIAQYPRQAHDRVEVPQLFDTRFGDRFAERLDAAIDQARGKAGGEVEGG